jgi:uncharacterized membrane protein HdeD (DUF308 family)
MTNALDTLRNPQASSDIAPLSAKWGWIVALGVVYLLAGLGSVVMVTVASVFGRRDDDHRRHRRSV